MAGTIPVLAQRAASEGWGGTARPFFLLAEAARSECPVRLSDERFSVDSLKDSRSNLVSAPRFHLHHRLI
ncbi:MAG: hypothetical protein ABI980_15185 [Nitrospirota bacterium]